MPGSDSNRKIFLVGFMAAGKSTVGKMLAARLGLPFIDLDLWIEATEERRIPQIFAEDGEAYFRSAERRALQSLISEPAAVVALGGGCVTVPGNWDWIRKQGVSVYLWCPVELLVQRLQGDGSRPLLSQARGVDLETRVATLLSQREPDYRQADWVVEQGPGDSAEEIVDRILRCLESSE